MESSPTPDSSTTNGPFPFLLLVADDLMFPSRIREGARPLGYAVQTVGTGDAALAKVTAAEGQPLPAAILVNLTARRYDPHAVIRALKSDPAARSIPLLAFAGHVETEKHDAARAAGADMVVANSSVSLHLGKLLPRLLSGDSTAAPAPMEADADI